MDNKTLSDLIGLIYDAAFDANLWPRLLRVLAEELGPVLVEKFEENSILSLPSEDLGQSLDAFQSTSLEAQTSKFALITLLRSHFTRALELNRRIFETSEELFAMQELFERLPLGMLIVDSKSRVVTYNRKLDQIIADGKGLSIQKEFLNAGSLKETVKLRQAIQSVVENRDPQGRTIHLSSPDSDLPFSALILPLNVNFGPQGDGNNKAVVLVSAPEMHLEISEKTLMSIYKLTGAEAKLVSSLVKDRTLNSIAEDFGVSRHTIRNQLKSIYEKTGTHRQAELVRQVITGPAMLTTISGQKKPSVSSDHSAFKAGNAAAVRLRRNQTIRLPDGRQLGFAEYGAADGRPVMLMHGSYGSRLDRHPKETIVTRCDVRLIVPDRPGVGLSDSKKGMTLLNWAQDLSFLADHLRLKTFNLIGYSMGAPFGLACAHYLGDRINRLVIVAGVAPFNSIWELEEMYLPFRLMLSFGRYAHALLEPLVRFINIQVKPEAYLKELWRNMPPVDRALLSDTAIKARMIESARESLRQGNHYTLQEMLLVARHWGFELCDVKIPVDIWHGALDRVVPPRMARNMAQDLPNCRTHFLPGAGHFLLFHCWKEILLSAISDPVPTSTPLIQA